ncbi:MAG: hypothetical protein FWD28_10110 [Treponema sp.]|nr:hypothetical protein [Treponema sp.]
MKRIFIVLILFVCILCASFSDETKYFTISLGVWGIGFNTDSNITSGYVYGNFFNFNLNTSFGLGISFSPINFYMYPNNENNSLLTFVNGVILYNFFNSMWGFVLGPFASINAVTVNNPQHIDFRAGLRFSHHHYDFDIFSSDDFILEIGYKYNNSSRHGFFIHFGMDMLTVFSLLSYLYRDEAKDRIKQEQW